MLKLNIGAGETRIDGFIPIDRKFGTEAYPLPAQVDWDDETYALTDNSVDEIRASHILEHFSFKDVSLVLKEWSRVLKPGGLMKVAVPDVNLILKAAEDDKLWQHYLMGGQTDADDFHRSVFTEQALRDQMDGAGLVDIKPWASDNTDCASHKVSVNIQGTKPQPSMTIEAITDTPRTQLDVKICCCTSIPRVGFNDHWGNLMDALTPYDIPVVRFTGAFWGHGMQKMFVQCCESGVDWIMSIDYDSMITEQHLKRLFETFARNDDIDALTCVQAKRNNKYPLLYREDAVGKPEERAKSDERGLILVDSAHFGLTLIRASKLRDLPLPWFASKPDSDGSYDGKDRIDEDIWFWKMWKKAGRSLYVDIDVRIGHLELMVSEFDADLEHRYLTINEWKDLYKVKREI